MYMCANILSNNLFFLRSQTDQVYLPVWRPADHFPDLKATHRSAVISPWCNLGPSKKNIFFGSWGKHNQEKATQETTHSSQIFALLYRVRLLILDEKRKLVAELLFFWGQEMWWDLIFFWRKEKWWDILFFWRKEKCFPSLPGAPQFEETESKEERPQITIFSILCNLCLPILAK